MLFKQSRLSMAIVGLILFSSFGFTLPMVAQTKLPVTIATKKQPPTATKDAFLIVPGQSVGKITNKTDRAQLATIFGKSNLEDFTERGPEGLGEAAATRVKMGGQRSLDVLWQDEKRQKIASIAIYDSRWHLADGLAVGMTVDALQKKFGKFSFYGFGWDYSGTVISDNNPKLAKYREQSKVNFVLGVSRERCQQLKKDCRAVMGDGTFESDNPNVVRLKPGIEVLYVQF